MTEWSYLLADLATNAPLAEVPMSGVRYTQQLNKAGTLRGTLHIDERLATRGIDFYDVTTPCRRCVYVLRDGQPQWGGIIWTRDYDSSQQAIQLGAADWWSYFNHRKVLPVLPMSPDVDYVAGLSTSYTDVEQNEIARNLVQQAQQHTGGDLGIQLDTADSGIWRDRTYYGYELKSVGEALSRLSGVIDGPDMRFGARRESDGSIARTLHIGTPHLGQQGSPHVWEYGGNIVSYRWPSDGASMATRAYAGGDGIEEGTLIGVSEDHTRYSDGWPLLETEQGYTSVTVPSTLQEHADSDQRTARLPVVLPRLTVRGDMAPHVGEFGPGDDGRVVIKDRFHTQGLDAYLRIVGIEVTPDSTDGEQATLTTAPLIEGPDIT